MISILEENPSIINSNTNFDRQTPLYYAIKRNHLSTCEILINYGADVNIKDGVRNLFIIILSLLSIVI